MESKGSGTLNWMLAVAAMVALVSLAGASMVIPANEIAKGISPAPGMSPAIGPDWTLERIEFVHYAKPALPARPPKAEKCYKLLGVKWGALPVDYRINPANLQGLDEAFVAGAIGAGAETWDSATSSELVNDAYIIDYGAQYGVQNFENAIAFGDYPDNNVIAVTSVWYTPVGRRIVEFDMLFNTRFAWGDATIDPAKMDVRNIATHEWGHGLGLDDLYVAACENVTMYGYSEYGETKKRTLEQPDITGLQKMYGS